MIIRWMGAYRGRRIAVTDALDHEWVQTEQVAAAATAGDGGSLARHRDILVGLLVRPDAVLRYYAGDSWTEPTKTGKARATRSWWTTSREQAVAHPESVRRGYSEATLSHRKVGPARYYGLVIRCPRALRSTEVQDAISWARGRGLAVYVLTQGRLAAYRD